MKPKLIVAIAAIAALPHVAFAGGATTFDKSMQPILQSYLTIHNALASDKMVGVTKAAEHIAKATKKLDASSVTGKHAEHYKDLPSKLRKAAKNLARQKDLEKAREAFKELSKPMAMWGTMSKPKGIVVAFCSMAKGSWLQKKGDIRNPYYGTDMLSCGEVVGGDDSPAKHSGKHHGDMKHE